MTIIRCSLNNSEDFILVIVEFLDGDSPQAYYMRQPLQHEPGLGGASVNHDFEELHAGAKTPS